MIDRDPTPAELIERQAMRDAARARHDAQVAEWEAQKEKEASAARRASVKATLGTILTLPFAIAIFVGLVYLVCFFPVYGLDPSPLWTR